MPLPLPKSLFKCFQVPLTDRGDLDVRDTKKERLACLRAPVTLFLRLLYLLRNSALLMKVTDYIHNSKL